MPGRILPAPRPRRASILQSVFHARLGERRARFPQPGARRGTTLALTEDIRESVRSARLPERWAPSTLLAAGIAVAIFLFYFAPYPIRHARLPAGFDAAWYVWRATFVGARGI